VSLDSQEFKVSPRLLFLLRQWQRSFCCRNAWKTVIRRASARTGHGCR